MAQPEIATTAGPRAAWRQSGGQVSLPEVHRTIVVPQTASFWRKLMAFSGPGFLVAVGYMDPGNWATDLAGGARFGYSLLCVIMISNLMAILLQHLCIKLGVATGVTWPKPAAITTRGRSPGFSGFCARSQSLHAIWPKWLARPSGSNCSSASRWCGDVSSL